MSGLRSITCVTAILRAAFLATATLISSLSVAAVLPSDGIYEVQAPTVRSAPRFIIESGKLRHASGALHTPLCQLLAESTVKFPVTELQTFFSNAPGTQILDRGDGHYLLTSGLVLDEHLQFQQVGSGSSAAIYAELDFITGDEAVLTLQAATPYFLGEGLDTTHCLAHSQFKVKKMGS